MKGFFCLFIPQFPAWVWEQSSPQVRGQGFVVIEREQVVAVSPTALEAGLTVGMTSNRAQSRWRSAAICASPLLLLERDRRREELAWSEVQRAVYGLTPKVEPLEPGLLFADVESAKALTLVKGLEVRGGFARDRATAQLAALCAPHQTTRSVPAGKERAFANQLALHSLQGLALSAATVERLKWFGWTHLGQLKMLTRRQMEEQLGSEATLLFHFAQGQNASANLRPIATWQPPSEIVARIEFDPPVREPNEWNGALDELLQCVCQGLGTQQAQTLEIEADTPIKVALVRRVLKEPLSSPQSLRRPTESALGQALGALSPLPPIVRALTIRLGGLTTAPIQEVLFVDERLSQQQRLQRTLERLESRFTGCTGRYSLADPHSPFPEELYAWRNALDQKPQPSRLARARSRFSRKGER